MEYETNVFLLRNAFQRRGIIQRVSIFSALFILMCLLLIYGLPHRLIYLFYIAASIYLALLVFLFWKYKAYSYEFSIMKIENQILYLPRSLNPNKYKTISLKNVYSVQLRGNDDCGFIMLGIKNGLNKTLITSQFKEKKDISKFIEYIRQMIIFNEGGEEKLNIREKLGESYVSITPICSITISIILLIFFLLQQIMINNSNIMFELLRLGGLNKCLLLSGEYFRVTNTVFLHLNFLHLIINIFTLIIFGSLIEHIIGKVNIAVIFLISGIFGSLLSAIFEQYVVTIGASGAIYGIIGAYLFIRIKYRNVLPTIIKAQQGWFLFLIFSLSIGFSLISSSSDFFCHFGGLIAGFFYTMILSYVSKNKINSFYLGNKIINIVLIITIIFYIINLVYGSKFLFSYNSPKAYESYIIESFLDKNGGISSDQEINFISYYIANKQEPEINKLQKAKTMMETVVDRRPNNHQCKDTLALIYFKLGLFDEAILLQKQAILEYKSQEYITKLEKYKKNKIATKADNKP